MNQPNTNTGRDVSTHAAGRFMPINAGYESKLPPVVQADPGDVRDVADVIADAMAVGLCHATTEQ